MAAATAAVVHVGVGVEMDLLGQLVHKVILEDQLAKEV